MFTTLALLAFIAFCVLAYMAVLSEAPQQPLSQVRALPPAPTPMSRPLTPDEVIEREVAELNVVLDFEERQPIQYLDYAQSGRIRELRSLAMLVREPVVVGDSFSEVQQQIQGIFHEIREAASRLDDTRQNQINYIFGRNVSAQVSVDISAKAESFRLYWFSRQLQLFQTYRERLRPAYLANLRQTTADNVKAELVQLQAYLNCTPIHPRRLTLFTFDDVPMMDPCRTERQYIESLIPSIEALLPALPEHEARQHAERRAEALRTKAEDLEQQLEELGDQNAILECVLEEYEEQLKGPVDNKTAAEPILRVIQKEIELQRACQELKRKTPSEWHARIDREFRKAIDQLREEGTA